MPQITGMRVVMLACSYVVAAEESCTPTKDIEPSTLGQSMLQAKQQRTEAKDASLTGQDPIPLPHCQLPPGAKFCQVRLQNLPPYLMAVYDGNGVNQDWVSKNICDNGFWEEQEMSAFGAPGQMMDIGGNIGYHTFAFAQAGWNVVTFEPMAPNLAMIDATMCQNPGLAAKIRLNRHGLGTANQTCQMVAPKDNVGDGFTLCGNPGEQERPADKFKQIGTFEVRRLDEVLQQQGVKAVDLVKIDVEGYEYQVFAGAPNFLAQYKPRLIKSELWVTMVGSRGDNYLSMFEAQGYKFFTDNNCLTPIDAKNEVNTKGGMDVVMCQPVGAAPLR